MSASTVNPDPDTPFDKSKFRKVLAASMAGTVAEWYEFLLYGMAAALVFGDVFFNSGPDQPLDGVIAAMLTYAVGFFARPLGGVIFGHLGDKFGRKKLLQASLLLIGTSTFLIGAIPSFDSIGYLAPLLLVLLRFAQGVAVGGEWGGAVLLVAEHSPKGKRAFYASFPQAGAPFGNILATVVLLVLSATLTEDAFLAWGWRVAFFLSAVIVLIGWFIRREVQDAEIFVEAAEEEQGARNTWHAVRRVMAARRREVLTAMGARVVENILYYVVVTFSLTYMSVELEMNTSTILSLMLVSHFVHGLAILGFGWLADRWGRKPVYMLGTALGATWALAAFPLFDSRSTALALLAITLGMLIHAIMYAPQPALFAEMFPTSMRYVGISLSVQVVAIFAGSLAPLICSWLLKTFGTWEPIALYVGVAGLISFAASTLIRETRGSDLRDVDAEVHQTVHD